jgi:uncharacterized membrane protein YqjE
MSARPAGPPAAHGLLEALRAIGTTLGEIVRVRGALFGIELRDEVQRRKRMLVLAAAAAMLLHLALILATVFVAVAFWDTYRLSAIGAMAAFYLACGAGVLLRLRADAAASPAPFAATVGELERDFADFRTPR